MPQDINELRKQLFITIEALNNKEAPMDIERARAVSEVAQTIINSAKVEVEFAKLSGTKTSEFLPTISGPVKPQLPANTSSPMPGVLVHKLKG
jgi:hypothetical protein